MFSSGHIHGESLELQTGSSAVSGQPVNGQLVLNLCRPREFKKIVVSLEGRERAVVRYTERERCSSDGTSRTVTRYAHGDECLVHLRQIVFSRGYLQAGKHFFPFSFAATPPTLPSSFESSQVRLNASIRYELIGEADNHHNTMKNIRPIEFMLPTIVPQQLTTPMWNEADKMLSCCCAKQGHLCIRGGVTRSAFYGRGDRISLKCFMENDSTRDIALQARLYCRTGLSVRCRRQDETICVGENKSHRVPAGARYLWETTINLSGLQPTTCTSMINVSYYLIIEACVSMGFNLKLPPFNVVLSGYGDEVFYVHGRPNDDLASIDLGPETSNPTQTDNTWVAAPYPQSTGAAEEKASLLPPTGAKTYNAADYGGYGSVAPTAEDDDPLPSAPPAHFFVPAPEGEPV
ncbi:Arrestin domain-containing protein A [Diplonema papillatum]|nr:Arrestin domain-containing protein A [Diplonema papillatum]